MAAEAVTRAKLVAGLGFVVISTCVGLLYKVSQTGSGGFKYSTTSAVAMAEMLKLAMSVSFHLAETSPRQEDGGGRLLTAWRSARAQVSLWAIMHIWALAALYTLNNQLSFYVYTLVDPGTVYLFKAASTLIVAVIQCLLVGKTFTSEQWKAMLLQGCGMVIVQYNPCKSTARYRPLAYGLMALSTAVTSITAVRNEYIIKNFGIALNVMNAVLYAGGSLMNVFAFACLPNPSNSKANIGFFEGYNNPRAVGVVCVNALIGLVISAVYKHADAVTKCIASDITAVLLCVISATLFELEPSVTLWCGVFVVISAVHQFASGAPAPAAPPQRAKSEAAAGGGAAPDSNGDQSKAGAEQEQQELTTMVGKRAA